MQNSVMIPFDEANQNFSKVAKLVDENKDVIILKNNKPTYIVSKFNNNVFDENDKLELVAKQILSKHKRAFEVLGND